MSETVDQQITTCTLSRSSLTKQLFILILSAVPPAVLLVAAGQKLICPESNFFSPLSALLFVLLMLLALITGVPTIFRVKKITVNEDGIHVKTWVSELELPWPDVLSTHQFSFRSLLVRSRQGCFLLGQELPEFNRLADLIATHIANRTPASPEL